MWSIDSWDTAADLQNWENTYTPTWPDLWDSAGTTDNTYGVTAAPSIVIINTAGVVQFTHLGNPGSSTLISEIQSLIPQNQPPVASFVWSPDPAIVNQVVTFDGSASSDPDGTIVSYAWTFGDGGTGTGVNPTHTYTTTGTKSVTLTVTDNGTPGLTGTTTKTVTVSVLAPPTITVTCPNGGEKWVRGTTHTIRWTSTGSPCACVHIELLKCGVYVRTLATHPNDGAFSWTIPSWQTLGADYKIRIHCSSNKAITDSSDSNFAIVRGTLTVTSPNGGEHWKHGTWHTITWSKSGCPGSYVKIELLKGGVVVRVITYSTYNDGSYCWYIPSTQTPGSDYKIRIRSTAYPSIKDSSNSNFIIVT